MATIYEILRSQKGAEYKKDKIKKYSYLHKKPNIDKPAGALAGLSRIHGDVSPKVQDRIIDILIEIGARYKLSYRDIAHMLLMCKIESGFNPDAAAGTTSASGLGQFTEAGVEEAAKKHISKKRLDFTLDLSGDYRFDAERGAFGVLLSYMICKEKAKKHFHENYEKYLYIFHHEGWYFSPTAEHLAAQRVKDVRSIINKKILPFLDSLEKLLSQKTNLSFKLITKDEKPHANQPYIAIVPAAASAKKAPSAVQGAPTATAKHVFGKTDGAGLTQPLETSGLSEVVFVVLNQDYKDYLNVSSSNLPETHTVAKNETLSRIAEENHTTVAALQQLNNISDPNKIHEGQQLVVHGADYLWRRPPMELVQPHIMNALNINAGALECVIEHKRSHIVLPEGNEAQKSGGTENVVVIKSGTTSAQVAAQKKEKDVPHQTKEASITKDVPKASPGTGGAIRDGLLYPLPIPASESYKTGQRKFGANRDKGRRHGGCDLYAPLGTEVRAMADGVILQCYNFYWHTDAVEVDHGGFIVRYGEVKPRSDVERGKLVGKKVKRGETIGNVGQLIKDNGEKYSRTMLHLEIYSSDKDTLKDRLTNKNHPPYQRRSDLVDPAPTLDKCVMK